MNLVAASKRLKSRMATRAALKRRAASMDADSENQLKRRKLQLEIFDLQRSNWAKPGVLVPILATIATLFLSQYLGVFDIARQRSELAKSQLKQDIELLESERADLNKAKLQLAAEIAEKTNEAAVAANEFRGLAQQFFPALLTSLKSNLSQCINPRITPGNRRQHLNSHLTSCLLVEFDKFEFSHVLVTKDKDAIRSILISAGREVTNQRKDLLRRLIALSSRRSSNEDERMQIESEAGSVMYEYAGLLDGALAPLDELSLFNPRELASKPRKL